MKNLIFALAVSLLAVVGCKKEEAATAEGDPAAKPAETAEAAGAAEAEAPAEAPTGDVNPKTGYPDDLTKKGMAFMKAMGDAVTANEADCDKVAAAWSKLQTENKGTIDMMKAYEAKVTPEQKKAFEEMHKADLEAMMGAMMPVITKCQDSDSIKKVLESM